MPVCLTFDIDWAPDHSIYELLHLLQRYNCKGLFFLTHSTPINKVIEEAGHELGIHPNFYPGSSQGDTVSAVLKYLTAIQPRARVFRTHGLLSSTALLAEICDLCPQLIYDFSLYTPGQHLIQPVRWSCSNKRCIRLPFSWEDDCQLGSQNPLWFPSFDSKYFTAINYHPIHITLNSCDLVSYSKLKNRLSDEGKRLYDASEMDLACLRNNSIPGVMDSLAWVLETNRTASFSDLLRAIC